MSIFILGIYSVVNNASKLNHSSSKQRISRIKPCSRGLRRRQLDAVKDLKLLVQNILRCSSGIELLKLTFYLNVYIYNHVDID